MSLLTWLQTLGQRTAGSTHPAGAEEVPAPLTGRPRAASPDTGEIVWPPLPAHGFVAGRSATRADVENGRAAFCAAMAGREIGRPIPAVIPQDAMHVDETGKRTAGIVIQAEQVGPLRIIGFKPLTDSELLVATEAEFEFLGTQIVPR